MRQMTGAAAAALIGLALGSIVPCVAAELSGRVTVGGAPVGDATVTLWQAGTGAPRQLGETHSALNGSFTFSNAVADENAVRYIVASGGNPAKGGGSATLALMNVPNFVNLETGSWGRAILNPFSSYRSTTLAKFGTLASLITYAAAAANDDWRQRFFAAATPYGGTMPSNTLEAMAGIARQSFAHPKELFALFNEAYPQAKDGSSQAAPFVPYLFYEPEDFSLILVFAGGGIDSAGRLMFDAEGNAWIGNNWMPGSQSSVVRNIGGALAELTPDGTPLSPPVTGFRGAGIDSIGWGGAVTLQNVWAPSLNGKILVTDFDGHPVADPSDFPFKEKVSGLMGTGVARNGDVWITAGADDALLYFPGGRVKEGRIGKPPGLASPFDVVVDDQNRVWVSNSQSDTVSRFPIDQPNNVQTFHVGISPRGMALDSKNNVWISNLISPEDLQYIPKSP
jgi:hypothetical protein